MQFRSDLCLPLAGPRARIQPCTVAESLPSLGAAAPAGTSRQACGWLWRGHGEVERVGVHGGRCCPAGVCPHSTICSRVLQDVPGLRAKAEKMHGDGPPSGAPPTTSAVSHQLASLGEGGGGGGMGAHQDSRQTLSACLGSAPGSTPGPQILQTTTQHGTPVTIKQKDPTGAQMLPKNLGCVGSQSLDLKMPTPRRPELITAGIRLGEMPRQHLEVILVNTVANLIHSTRDVSGGA